MTLPRHGRVGALAALLFVAGWAAPGTAAPSEPGVISSPSRAAAPDSARLQPASSTLENSVASDLGPTSAVPWNPPRAVPSAEAWEEWVRLPGRIASLPLVALGYAAERGLTAAERTSFVQGLISQSFQGARLPILGDIGVSLGASSLGPRTGLGGRVRFSPPWLDPLLALELSGSTRKYNRTRVLLHRGPAQAEYVYDWRPEEPFFGLGLQSSADATSAFASQSQLARISVAYPWREDGWLPPAIRAGAWLGTREMVPRTGR